MNRTVRDALLKKHLATCRVYDQKRRACGTDCIVAKVIRHFRARGLPRWLTEGSPREMVDDDLHGVAMSGDGAVRLTDADPVALASTPSASKKGLIEAIDDYLEKHPDTEPTYNWLWTVIRNKIADFIEEEREKRCVEDARCGGCGGDGFELTVDGVRLLLAALPGDVTGITIVILSVICESCAGKGSLRVNNLIRFHGEDDGTDRAIEVSTRERSDRREDDDPELAAVEQQQGKLLPGYLQQLPDKERQVVQLYYWGLDGEGAMTQAEIAARLQLSQQGVSKVLNRALKQLKDKFGG